ncbi:MAG TPA: hypothetical protein VMT19_08475 [Thermoanaerobaculaceae bacterium]|nr:hypothetical protein [Thermoanaerobaculaceae bacterium]
MPGRVLVLSIVAAAANVLAAAPPAAAQGGPRFTDTVLEMTPATLDRLGNALAMEESSRRSIAASANAPAPMATKTKEEYASCQMELMMTPEFQRAMQEATAAMSAPGRDPAAAQTSGRELQDKLQAMVEARCGPDPGKVHRKPDVGSALRQATSDAAKANGFTDRQYAILKERVVPLCLSDPKAAGRGGLKVPGQGPVFFVYSAAEVEALRPRCDAFARLIVTGKS